VQFVRADSTPLLSIDSTGSVTTSGDVVINGKLSVLPTGTQSVTGPPLAQPPALLADSTGVRVRALNLYVTNGMEGSKGDFASTNGLGNIVVGIQSGPTPGPGVTGSHNLILGDRNSAVSHGAIVAGAQNTSYSAFASVLGGFGNTAGSIFAPDGAPYSVVLGGISNTTGATAATVSGGQSNSAVGDFSAVLGGGRNQAGGANSIVAGGAGNMASGTVAAVLGGTGNDANGPQSAIVSGFLNKTTGAASSISGGYNNFAMGDYSSILGDNGTVVDTTYGHAP
jgi:hypothetical protein